MIPNWTFIIIIYLKYKTHKVRIKKKKKIIKIPMWLNKKKKSSFDIQCSFKDVLTYGLLKLLDNQ